MLHCDLLSHADDLWRAFFESLELVFDEVHEYRGVFGSHVGLVLRRLMRLCERFDATPQFVCCSATIGNPRDHAATIGNPRDHAATIGNPRDHAATIGNPRDHAATITGQPTNSFALVDEETSETGPTHWLFWQPPKYGDWDAPAGAGQRRSHRGETMRLFVDLVQRGYQTVAFTRIEARMPHPQGARETSE